MGCAAAVRLKKKVYDSPEELRLVHAAKAGDEQAFRALYDAHHGRVFVAINRMLSNDEMSLWVANLALTRVWKGLPGFKEKSKFSTWVTRIAINEAKMHLRSESRRYREVSLDALLSPAGDRDCPTPTPQWLARRDLELEGVADRQVLERAICRVPEQFREVLRMRFWEGLSLYEIRDKISGGEPEAVSISAVKSRILRGRAVLIRQVGRIS